MKILYHGGGASITELGDQALPDADWAKVRTATLRLLRARKHADAATALDKYPFKLVQATNFFQDDFTALRLTASLDQYVELTEVEHDATLQQPFRRIAETISEIGPYVRFVVMQLEEHDGPLPVASPSPKITSDAVESALADAELLLRSRGPASAMDRVHTAMHGYLRAALERTGATANPTASATDLFKQLRTGVEVGDFANRDANTKRIIMSLASVVDAANTLRNTASAAHPNETLLEAPEAMLVINAVRSLVHYLDDRLARLDDIS